MKGYLPLKKGVVFFVLTVFLLQIEVQAKVNTDSLFLKADSISQPQPLKLFLKDYCYVNENLNEQELENIFRYCLARYIKMKANKENLSIVYVEFIDVISDKGFLNSAEKICQQGLEEFKGEICPCGRLNMLMGKIYNVKGDYQESIDYSFKALQILDKTTSCEKDKYYALRDLCIKYGQIGDSLKADEFLLSSYQFSKQSTDSNLRADAIVGILENRIAAKKYQEAEQYFQEFTSIKSGVNELFFHLAIDNLYGSYLIEAKKEYQAGIALLEKTIIQQRALGDDYSIMYLLLNKGNAELITKQYDKGKLSFKEALDISIKVKSTIDKLSALEGLSQAENHLGNIQAAFELKEWAYKLLKDTLKKEQLVETTRELDAKYQLKGKNNKIQLLEKENKLKQRNIQYRNVLILMSILILGFTYVLYRRMKLKKDLDKQKSLEQERNRIASELHDDLGSNVTAIKMLSDLATYKNQDTLKGNELEKISKNASKLIANMSDIIWAMNTNNDSPNGLMQYIKMYAEGYLEEHDIRLEFNWDTTAQANPIHGEKRRNILLVVKEILHNTVKHAQANLVSIDGYIKNNLLHMTIQDNGKGFSDVEVKQFSNGIKNMEARMLKMGGQLQMKNQDGTHIFMQIPL